MTLIFLPGIGFIIYLFCGRGIDGQEVFKLSDDEKQMVQRINPYSGNNDLKLSHHKVNHNVYRALLFCYQRPLFL
jgi:cardiolipin synthase